MTVNIIVTTCDYLTYTKWCVRSIREYTKMSHKLIFVDDKSIDGTVEWLKKIPNATVLENESEKRRGWWAGNNIGKEYAKADYYAFIDRDMVVTPNWLTKCISLLQQRSEVGVVSPIKNSGRGEQVIPQGGSPNPNNPLQKFMGVNHGVYISAKLSWDEIQRFGRIIEETYRNRAIYNAPLFFSMVVIPHWTFDKVGKFDEDFFWAFGDHDYCYRCLQKKIMLAVRLDTYGHGLDYCEGQWHNQRFGSFYKKWYATKSAWKKKYPGKTDHNFPGGKEWNSYLLHKNEFHIK